MPFSDSNSNHYGNPLVTGNSPLARRISINCDRIIRTKCLESNSNHFGNPLVIGECSLTRSISSKYEASDSSIRDNNDTYLQQEFRTPISPGLPGGGVIYEDDIDIVSPSSNLSSTASVSSDFSTTIPSESESTCRRCHNRSFSYDSASICIPSSYYPAGQDSRSNLENIILEELQDFDELFGS